MVAIDWQGMTDEEFTVEHAACQQEQERRAVLANAIMRQNVLNAEVLTAQGVQQGDPWRQPQAGVDAYPQGALVTHNGQSWESTLPGNVWEPGVSGWHVVGVEWPDWVQPTGAHDAYPFGARVTHAGLHWTSEVDANVWEPGVYGWVEA